MLIEGIGDSVGDEDDGEGIVLPSMLDIDGIGVAEDDVDDEGVDVGSDDEEELQAASPRDRTATPTVATPIRATRCVRENTDITESSWKIRRRSSTNDQGHVAGPDERAKNRLDVPHVRATQTLNRSSRPPSGGP
jgi:hypothetical protein